MAIDENNFAKCENGIALLLKDQEEILEALYGKYHFLHKDFMGLENLEESWGMIALTGKRILIYGNWGIRMNKSDNAKYDLDKVIRVTHYLNSNLGGSQQVIKVETDDGKVLEFYISWGDYKKFVSTWESLRGKSEQSNNEPAPIDIPSLIRELAKLKDDGIISVEEFESKKKELLSKL